MPWLSPEQCVGFLVASLLITLTPGPDNLLVLSIGASRGRRSGVAFGLGCAAGCLSHTALAALGVSALIAASATAFTALKLAGGAYLIYLGWQALRNSGAGQAVAEPSAPSADAATAASAPSPTAWRLFGKGLIANAINPKVVMFFLAFLPQFVLPTSGPAPWQIVQLGLIFTLQAALLFGALGYFAGSIGAWLARHGRAGVWLDRIAGTVFVALGVRLMVSR